MAPASSSIEIVASAERVWAIVGGFDNLATWLDIIRSSTLEDGGRVRRREAVNGAVIVERLLSFDDAERRYSYCHVRAPDPVTGYVAEMRVEARPDDRARVTWSSHFTPTIIDEAEAIAH